MHAAQPLESIALSERSGTFYFDLALARRLKQEHGSNIHLYCSSPGKATHYESLNRTERLFDSISVTPLLEVVFEPIVDEAEVFSAARAYEERLGHSLNRIIMSNRHFGRGYALAGFRHPRSRQSEETSYAQVVQAYVRTLRFWEREFDEHGTTLLLNADKTAACASRLTGIPYRAMAGSRYRNYHYWAVNEYYESPAFAAAYRTASGDSGLTLEAPYAAHLSNRNRYRKTRSLRDTARAMRRQIVGSLKDNLKGRSTSYYLRENLGYLWRMRTAERELRSIATTTLDDLRDQPFVFYPLHVEPETALQTISPENFFQLSTIAALSRDLPASVVLAVKEAFGAVGRRPADFYAQVAEFKNVVLLDTLELGLDCVARSNAVATICGTAGLEGAVLGKPVVAFGRHNLYDILDHVRVVTDDVELGPALQWALTEVHDPTALRKEGARMLEAIVAASFDMREYDYNCRDVFDETSLEECHAALVESLRARTGAVASA